MSHRTHRMGSHRVLSAAGMVALLAWIALSGCTPKISDRDLVLIEPREVSDLMKGHGGLFGLGHARACLVDPRVTAEYEQGHLPGAISIPFQLISQRYPELHGYETIIVYGADFEDPKADAMSKRLLELGFKNVRTLRGGIRAWLAAGYTLETGP